MTTMKRLFGSLSAKKEDQQMNRRIILNINTKRDVWNSRRRFCY